MKQITKYYIDEKLVKTEISEMSENEFLANLEFQKLSIQKNSGNIAIQKSLNLIKYLSSNPCLN